MRHQGSTFLRRQRLIGMVHLPPLPGSPRYQGDWERVREQALVDARVLTEGGVDALLVENFGDAPFWGEGVEPVTVAAMAVLVREVKELTGLPCGVNVLRNDASAALAVAAAADGSFIRVNVHSGAMVTDQGLISGKAAQTLRQREAWRVDVEIWADVWVKHAVPLGPGSLEEAARDTWERGLADALIVSGPRTGQPADSSDVLTLRTALPEMPLVLGSGVNEDNLGEFVPHARGFIVGTSLKEGGRPQAPVSSERVRRLAARFDALRE